MCPDTGATHAPGPDRAAPRPARNTTPEPAPICRPRSCPFSASAALPCAARPRARAITPRPRLTPAASRRPPAFASTPSRAAECSALSRHSAPSTRISRVRNKHSRLARCESDSQTNALSSRLVKVLQSAPDSWCTGAEQDVEMSLLNPVVIGESVRFDREECGNVVRMFVV